MSRKYAGLILLVVILDTVAAALMLKLGGAGLRVLVGLPFALVLPGLALTSAAFPAGRLEVAERILLSLGLSLAVTTLGGLLLDLTPWGLRPRSWVALLGLITVVAGGVALARWRQHPAAATPGRSGLSWAQALVCGLAALVLVGALTLTVRGAEGQATVGFTQLWMTQADGGNAAVDIGLSNREPDPTEFRLQFEVDQRVRRTWTLTLQPGETWEQAVALPSDLPQAATIETVLYRGDSPSVVYRRVKLQRGQQ